MNKEKIFKTIKSKIGIGIISGILCFGLGGAVFSDTTQVALLKNENVDLTNKFNAELTEKDNKIAEKDNEIKALQSKVDEAKPWFDEKRKEEELKLAEEAKIAEEKAKAEAEQAKKDAEIQATKDAEKETKKEEQGVNTSEVKGTVESAIKTELSGQVKNTKLTSLTINENLGTEGNTKDVIVLADLSWSVKNGEKTTKEMITMYSDHLAAKLASKLANDSEIALFWNAEYTGLDIKHSYYIENGNAYKQ